MLTIYLTKVVGDCGTNTGFEVRSQLMRVDAGAEDRLLLFVITFSIIQSDVNMQLHQEMRKSTCGRSTYFDLWLHRMSPLESPGWTALKPSSHTVMCGEALSLLKELTGTQQTTKLEALTDVRFYVAGSPVKMPLSAQMRP
ncbi:Hypothetical predicted protein [Scomber scombrus]|uniref:Uncharacterized protein n=1 Tax=Scomber scombrus TaxID=13677 RepID=A0AAV1NHR1_SCOSC